MWGRLCSQFAASRKGELTRGHTFRDGQQRDGGAVNERCVHACGPGACFIAPGVVADMEALCRGHASGVQGGCEDARMRFACADFAGEDDALKSIENSQSAKNGMKPAVKVGQDKEAPVLTQQIESW